MGLNRELVVNNGGVMKVLGISLGELDSWNLVDVFCL